MFHTERRTIDIIESHKDFLSKHFNEQGKSYYDIILSLLNEGYAITKMNAQRLGHLAEEDRSKGSVIGNVAISKNGTLSEKTFKNETFNFPSH